ncbi:MAG: hypothetical protein DMD81_10510 [Candidatus Rokuibacteriota bacterium]|nr:MAG: hypothetical protein DMD81_10510 [Candidatus Rokubacteria bacterium]
MPLGIVIAQSRRARSSTRTDGGTYDEASAVIPNDKPRRGWKKLGEILVERGLVSEADVGRALERQPDLRQRLGKILVDQGLLTEDQLLECLAAQFDKLLMTEEDLVALPAEVVRIIPEATALQNGVIAVERTGRQLVVAIADPLNVLRRSRARSRVTTTRRTETRRTRSFARISVSRSRRSRRRTRRST